MPSRYGKAPILSRNQGSPGPVPTQTLHPAHHRTSSLVEAQGLQRCHLGVAKLSAHTRQPEKVAEAATRYLEQSFSHVKPPRDTQKYLGETLRWQLSLCEHLCY